MTEFTQFAKPGEQKIARKLVREALRRGYVVSVWDGEEWALRGATKLQDVLDQLCSTGQDVVSIRKPRDGGAIKFLLVWGNDPEGCELIADHTDSPAGRAIYSAVMGDTE